MSLPWLKKNNPSQNSKSRSRSPTHEKPRTKVDQFGRSLPSQSKSRSRSCSSSSRDRSLSGDNRHSRESSRSRKSREDQRNSNRGQKRGRTGKFSREKSSRKRPGDSSSDSDSRSSSSDSSHTRIVASTKPKHLNARVFVANIISKDITREELVKQFEKYGDVIDLLVHTKNYAFIQYSKEEHARLAVEGEHGSTLKGWRLDVKMANENRKGGNNKGGGRGDERGGRGSRSSGSYGGFNRDRDRSPLSGGSMRGSFLDPYFDGRPRPPVAFVGDYRRDPYFMDPYRRGLPDPWLADDPYRRGLYADPYRDIFGLRPPPPPVIECEVFIASAQLRAYGQAVELRIKEHNIITTVSVMPEGRTPAQLVEELTAHSGLFAIFINPQNEMHRSLTVNILHGIPQEHRNMPLDDAVTLVGKSFLKYVEGLRDKAQAAATPLPTLSSSSAASVSRVFLPPTPEVSYLLNLLADNRALTIAELNTVIEYLHERRDKLIDAESRPLLTEDSFSKSPPLQHGSEPQLANLKPSASRHEPSSVGQEASASKQELTAASSSNSKSLSEDLTSKILSLFGSSHSNIQGVPPANGKQQQTSQPKLPTGAPAPSPSQASVPSSASLINFNNPNVQKALDNLIQNSPGFLKNMNTKTSLTAAQGAASAASMATMQGRSYERAAEIVAGQTQGQLLANQNPGGLRGSYGVVGQGAGQGSTGMHTQGTYNVSEGQALQGPMGRGYRPPEY